MPVDVREPPDAVTPRSVGRPLHAEVVRAFAPHATVDSVITQYFEERRDTLTGRRRARVGAAEVALRRCFKDHAEQVMTEAEQTLLGVERSFGEEGAAARVARADALLVVLPTFLLEGEWHGDDRVDRGLRHLAAWRLAQRIARLPELAEVDLDTVMGAINAAELRSRRALRRERADESRRELEERGATGLLDVLDRITASRPPHEEPRVPAITELRRPYPARVRRQQ